MLSRQEEVSLFAILFTAFQILLYRYTGQEDLLVGTCALIWSAVPLFESY